MRTLLTLLGMVTLLVTASADAAPDKDAVRKGDKYYRQLCAGCHGADGKGLGPNAKGLVTKPADLTRIAARRKGKFSADEVSKIIDGRYRKRHVDLSRREADVSSWILSRH